MTWAELLRIAWLNEINAAELRRVTLYLWLSRKFRNLSIWCSNRARAHLDLVDTDY